MKKLELKPGRDDKGERLDRFIARAGSVSRGEARRALDRGGVWIDGKRVKLCSRPVCPGQPILVVLEEAGRTELKARKLADERILYEDSWVIAVDKPPFVPAQATMASDRGNLVALVSERIGRQAGLVHRLDLETSGVTVFGKSTQATSALAAAFREGTAHKRYLAVASGELPDTGTIDLALSPDPRHPGRFVASPEGETPALTRFRVLSRRGSLMAVEARPETGRTHQIRVHLSSQHAPIVGDPLYGGPANIEVEGVSQPAGRVMLHARELVLPNPRTGAPLRLVAPVPADLAYALEAAGFDPKNA
jgi:23S rRNA pseudouridine1911/1915/1917 synthase